jgi:hypothetical protein
MKEGVCFEKQVEFQERLRMWFVDISGMRVEKKLESDLGVWECQKNSVWKLISTKTNDCFAENFQENRITCKKNLMEVISIINPSRINSFLSNAPDKVLICRQSNVDG